MTPIPSFDPLGLPAPFNIIIGLKVFGFWLHWFFMGIWFSGLLLSLLLVRFGKHELRNLGMEIIKKMPIFIAFGINAGIVPLLFVQTLYPNFFYPSTIIQGWFWFSVVPLVLIAYYGIYYFIFNFENPSKKRLAYGAGWLSSILFLFLGIIFTSEMEFMVSPSLWKKFTTFGPGGTIMGTSLDITTPSFLRYLIVFGLSTASVSALILFYKHFMRKNAEEEEIIKKVVLALLLIGTIIFGLAGLKYSEYIDPYIKNFLWWKWLAGLVPFATLFLGFLYFLKPSKILALLTFLGALASLLCNSIARQIVQIKEIEQFLNPSNLPLRVQNSPIILFLFALISGVFILAYLLKIYFRERSNYGL